MVSIYFVLEVSKSSARKWNMFIRLSINGKNEDIDATQISGVKGLYNVTRRDIPPGSVGMVQMGKVAKTDVKVVMDCNNYFIDANHDCVAYIQWGQNCVKPVLRLVPHGEYVGVVVSTESIKQQPDEAEEDAHYVVKKGLVCTVVRMYCIAGDIEYRSLPRFQQDCFQWDKCEDSALMYNKNLVDDVAEFILWSDMNDIQEQMNEHAADTNLGTDIVLQPLMRYDFLIQHGASAATSIHITDDQTNITRDNRGREELFVKKGMSCTPTLNVTAADVKLARGDTVEKYGDSESGTTTHPGAKEMERITKAESQTAGYSHDVRAIKPENLWKSQINHGWNELENGALQTSNSQMAWNNAVAKKPTLVIQGSFQNADKTKVVQTTHCANNSQVGQTNIQNADQSKVIQTDQNFLGNHVAQTNIPSAGTSQVHPTCNNVATRNNQFIYPAKTENIMESQVKHSVKNQNVGKSQAEYGNNAQNFRNNQFVFLAKTENAGLNHMRAVKRCYQGKNVSQTEHALMDDYFDAEKAEKVANSLLAFGTKNDSMVRPSEAASNENSMSAVRNRPCHTSDRETTTCPVMAPSEKNGKLCIPSKAIEHRGIPCNSTEQMNSSSKTTKQANIPSKVAGFADIGQDKVLGKKTEQTKLHSKTTGQEYIHIKTAEPVHILSKTIVQPSILSKAIVQPSILSKAIGQPSITSKTIGQPSITSKTIGQASITSKTMGHATIPSKTIGQESIHSNTIGQASIHSKPIGQASVTGKTTEQANVSSKMTEQANIISKTTEQPSIHSKTIGQPSIHSKTIGQPSIPSKATGQASIPSKTIGQASIPSKTIGQTRIHSKPIGRANIPSNPIGQASIPSNPIGQANIPSNPIGQANIPSKPIGQASIPSKTIGRANIPSNTIGQSSIHSKTIGQASMPSKTTEQPGIHSKTTEQPSIHSKTTEQPSMPSKTTEQPSIHSETIEQPSIPSKTTEQAHILNKAQEQPGIPSKTIGQEEISSKMADQTKIPCRLPEQAKGLHMTNQQLEIPDKAGDRKTFSSPRVHNINEYAPVFTSGIEHWSSGIEQTATPGQTESSYTTVVPVLGHQAQFADFSGITIQCPNTQSATGDEVTITMGASGPVSVTVNGQVQQQVADNSLFDNADTEAATLSINLHDLPLVPAVVPQPPSSPAGGGTDKIYSDSIAYFISQANRMEMCAAAQDALLDNSLYSSNSSCRNSKKSFFSRYNPRTLWRLFSSCVRSSSD